jgi:hypothetical protein
MLVLVLALVLVLVLALLGAGDSMAHGPWEQNGKIGSVWPGRHGGLNPGCLQETWIFFGAGATCWPICHLRICDALCPSYQDGNARK